ncbi:hypothetical protein [Geodermatophilus sp. DSM 45219]|uniref:hypothetical protein n=1 Tax=Geodermatophilus sp. DSM 45219 TaxID=1881103 RepID=UPI00087FBF96|nr:hypothetical protein [Geodermatophilus sp. DSM 45219]SDO22627.1 hypothetical protein SAMN05428965_3288 [Geodermatophilus sp. DSM 45219]
MATHLTHPSADPGRQALLLRTGSAVAPIASGLDECADVLTGWPGHAPSHGARDRS